MKRGKGRPIGSKSKPQIGNFITKQEVEKLLAKAKELAEYGNETMLKFLLEQVFGKAVQPIGGDKDNPIRVQITGMKIVKE